MHNLLLTILCLAAEPNPQPPIIAVAFTPNGAQVVTASQSGVEILSWPDLTPQKQLATQFEQVHDVVFSPIGVSLALAGGSPGESGAVELWEWPAAKLVRTLPAGGDLVYRAAWSADGKILALASADKSVRVQPVDGSPHKSLIAHSAAVLAVAWLDENQVCSAGVDQSLRMLSETLQVVRTFDNHTAPVRDLAIRPGERDGPPLLASASADRTVRFWQPTIGRLVRFAKLPSAPTAICWTPDGSRVLAACEDGRLRSVDPETVEVSTREEQLAGWAHAVAASPDGQYALLAGENGELRKVPLDAIKR